MYYLNFLKFASDWIPDPVRNIAIALVQYCQIVVNQLTITNNDFNTWAQEQLQEVYYNGQPIVLEYILNKKYGLLNAANKIYIDKTGNYLPKLFSFFADEGEQPIGLSYYRQESNEIPLTTTYFRSEYEVEYDYTFMVPNTLVFVTEDMEQTIRLYKAAGIRFQITTY